LKELSMDKLFWALTAPIGCPLEEFSEVLRTTVGPAVAKELADGTRVRVRMRDEPYSQRLAESPWLARVLHQGQHLMLDAIVDVVIPEAGARLDGVNAVLADAASTCQGWRVEATALADNLRDPVLGARSDYVGGGGLIQRPDGMSRDRFSIEWHIHGAHAKAKAAERERPMLRNIQNRIVEPVTSTISVLDGYEEAALPVALFEKFPVPAPDPSFENTTAAPRRDPILSDAAAPVLRLGVPHRQLSSTAGIATWCRRSAYFVAPPFDTPSISETHSSRCARRASSSRSTTSG
jgi:hypothetical protein